MKVLKVILLTSFLFVACFNTTAQLSYPLEISNTVRPSDIVQADIDGDGDDDILSASGEGIGWAENLGDNNFAIVQHLVNWYTNWPQATWSINVLDAELDGNTDILIEWHDEDYYPFNGLHLVRNLGGLIFSEPEMLSPDCNLLRPVVYDFNEDGFPDVATGSEDQVVVLMNDGLGHFTISASIPLLNVYHLNLMVIDMNYDSVVDLVYLDGGYGEVRMSIGLGGGLFDSAETVFDIDSIQNSLQVKDANSDGYYDVFYTRNEGSFMFPDLHWYVRLGNQNLMFSPEQEIDVPIDVNDIYLYFETDWNGDGLLDLWIILYNDVVDSYQLAFLTWDNYLTLNLDYTYSNSEGIYDGFHAISLQLDADPQSEILCSGSISNEWFLWNTGPGGLESEISLDDGMGAIHMEEFVDIDMDGDLDICLMCTSNGRLGWYENMGNEFSEFKLIYAASTQDLYMNLLVPVLNETTNQLTLFVFRYNNSSFKVEVIDGEFQDPEMLYFDAQYVESVSYSDYNNDGFTDWVYTTYSNLVVAMGAESEPLGNVVLESDDFLYRNVKWVDMNSDGLIDLIASSGLTEVTEVHIWLNNGSDISTWLEDTYVVDQNLYNGALEFNIIDRMNDGYLDFLYPGYPQISWWINYTPDGFSGMDVEPIELYSEDGNVDYDFDGDGLVDIIGAIDFQNYVYRNNGNGVFSLYCALPNLFYTWYYQGLNSHIADVDYNGSLEFIVPTQDEIFLNDLVMSYFPNPIGCTVFFDENMNAVFDGDDEYLSLVPLGISSNNEASVFQGNGIVWLTGEIGNFSITPYFDSNIWALTTDSSSYTFSIAQEGEIPNYPLAIGLYPLSDSPSVELTSVANGFSCANETFYLQVGVLNDGNAIMNGVLSVTINSDITEFLEFDIDPDSIIGNSAYWTVTDLLPGEFVNRAIIMSHPGIDFMGQSFLINVSFTRIVEVNEVLLSVEITSEYVVLCAYDPNDKSVSPEGFTDWGYIQSGTILEYTVRFQNTGNASAETVTILDQLDENLIFDTFELIGASHNLSVQRDDQGLITFHFPEIFLPDSGSDYLGSMGYVKYRIQSAGSIVPGTELKNTAYIYFDNNPPIVTNTVRNTIYTCDWLYGSIGLNLEEGTLNATDFAQEIQWYMNGIPIFGETEFSYLPLESGEYSALMSFVDGCQVMSEVYSVVGITEVSDIQMSIFPNPVFELLTIQFDSLMDGNLRICDLLGRVVMEEKISSRGLSLDVSVLGSGMYLITFLDKSGHSLSTSQFIKQ